MDIGLAGRSLYGRFRSGQLKQEDFPRVAAEEFGIRIIDLHSPDFEYENPADPVTSPVRETQLAAIERALAETGVTCWNLAVEAQGNLSSLDEAERLAAVENHRKWFNIAVRVGCRTMRVDVGGHGPPGTDEQQRDQCLKSVGSLTRLAEDRGLVLTIENHGGITWNPKLMLEIVHAVARPSFRILADFLNWPDGDDVLRSLEILAPYAFSVHAKFRTFDSDGECCEIDGHHAIQILRNSGYANPLCIEYETPLLEDEGIVLSRDLLSRCLNGTKPSRGPLSGIAVSRGPQPSSTADRATSTTCIYEWCCCGEPRSCRHENHYGVTDPDCDACNDRRLAGILRY